MVFLESGSVTLREFQEEDIENKVRWINDPSNNTYLHYELPLEYSKTLVWFHNKCNEKRLDLVIEYERVPVGLIGFLGIEKNHKKAEFYICLGEHQFKRRGIAKKATTLLLQYGFSVLHLNKVFLNVDAENVAACNLYECVGFLCEGYFKEDLFHRGRYIDRKRYAIFSNSLSAE